MIHAIELKRSLALRQRYRQIYAETVNVCIFVSQRVKRYASASLAGQSGHLRLEASKTIDALLGRISCVSWGVVDGFPTLENIYVSEKSSGGPFPGVGRPLQWRLWSTEEQLGRFFWMSSYFRLRECSTGGKVRL